MKSGKFGSQLDWKSKTWFFSFLNVYLSWIEQDKILISQLKTQKWISETVRAQKVEEKNVVICPDSFFPSWVMVLKLPKIVQFLQICADISKKSKCIKAIYLYSKDLMMLFQKIVYFIGVRATVHKILRNEISKKRWISKSKQNSSR